MATYVLKSDGYGTHKLDYLPIGYDQFTRNLERSKDWQSVNPNFDIKLEFVKDGAEYLINAYEAEGTEAQVFLDIYMEDLQDLIHKPEPIKCKIDFTNYKVNTKEGVARVSVDVERLGFAQKLKNGERVKVDLTNTRPLEGTFNLPPLPYKQINMHSKSILKLTEMKHREEEEEAPIFTFTRLVIDSGFSSDEFVDVYKKYTLAQTDDKVADEIAESFSYQTSVSTDGLPGYASEPPIMMKRRAFDFSEGGQTNINVNIDLTLIVEWIGYLSQSAYLVMVNVRNNEETELYRSLIANYCNSATDPAIGSPASPRRKTINLTQTAGISLNVKAGDELYIYIETDVEHHSYKIGRDSNHTYVSEQINVNNASISASSTTITESSFSQGIPFADAFTRTIESLTGEVGSFDNSFYALTDSYHQTAISDQLPGLRMLMSGIHVRGWAISEKPLVVTLADILKTAYTLDAVGFGVKEVDDKYIAYVAPVKDFYKDDVILSLGVVTNLEKRIDLDKVYSTLDLGYNKYDTDSVNSLDEFNGSREYKTYISAHDGKYEAVAPFRADGFGIETARRQSRLTAPNQSTPYDKDNFLVCFTRSGNQIVSEDGSILVYSSGLIDPSTSYNLRISPARILQEHEHLFSGCLQKGLDKDLKFTDGEVNVEMVSKITGEFEDLPESSDRQNSTLVKPIYLPELYEFEYVLTEDQIGVLEKDPHGTIEFMDENENLKYGYIQNVAIEYNRLAKFTLQRKHING